ncbi:MAG: DUF3137 domain-containing protein [Aureispira sp.]
MLSQQQIEQLLHPILQQLEVERKEVAEAVRLNSVQAMVGSILMLLFSISVAAIVFAVNGPFIFLLLFVIIPFIITMLHRFSQEKSTRLQQIFEEKVKTEVYQQLFKTWKADCTYLPTKFIPSADFKQAQLYASFNDYQGDDYCRGKLEDGRHFHFSELLVRQRINHAKEDPSSYQVIFKGLFFVLQGPHIFQTIPHPTWITPQKQAAYQHKKKKQQPPSKSADYKDSILDANFAASSAVKKEDRSLFDQLYQIKSPVQWTVRRKMSSNFQEQLNYMRVNLRQKVSLSFQGDKIYLAVPHNFDFWIVNAKESLLAPQRLSYLAWNFKIAFEILERLENATTID